MSLPFFFLSFFFFSSVLIIIIKDTIGFQVTSSIRHLEKNSQKPPLPIIGCSADSRMSFYLFHSIRISLFFFFFFLMLTLILKGLNLQMCLDAGMNGLCSFSIANASLQEVFNYLLFF